MDNQEFIDELNKEAINSKGQFQIEGQEPEYLFDVWGTITTMGARAIIKLTSEGIDVIDKVIDVIRKARYGKIIDIEITCPDGKTKMSLSAHEKQAVERLNELRELC